MGRNLKQIQKESGRYAERIFSGKISVFVLFHHIDYPSLPMFGHFWPYCTIKIQSSCKYEIPITQKSLMES